MNVTGTLHLNSGPRSEKIGATSIPRDDNVDLLSGFGIDRPFCQDALSLTLPNVSKRSPQSVKPGAQRGNTVIVLRPGAMDGRQGDKSKPVVDT